MTEVKTGIKSLSNRVSALESVVSTGAPLVISTPAKSFADQLISVTTNTLKDDLESVLQHYEAGLSSLNIDVNNFTMVDLVKAIPYTITYVESNASIIASIIKKDVTSAFKLNTAITLIKQYIDADSQLLLHWINSYVDILFNNGKSTLNSVLPNTKKSTISTGSISKAQSKRFTLSLAKSK